MKALAKLREVTDRLLPLGQACARIEAGLLLTSGMQADLVRIYKDNPDLDEKQSMAIDRMVLRRRQHEPLQYILGFNDFLGMKLFIGPGVLIPRPETELMAEFAIREVCGQEPAGRGHKQRIMDLCTGSGCLALALARALPSARVFGTDISASALEYASRNARENSVDNVSFLRGDLFEPVREVQFDAIVSNPPYIRHDEMKTLQPEIRGWEPCNALNGGVDGLDFYRRIISEAGQFLKDCGLLIFEIGDGQTEAVSRMLSGSGYTDIRVQSDYSGRERIIEAKWTR